MKIRKLFTLAVCCLTAAVALAADTGIAGKWVTDAVAIVTAARANPQRQAAQTAAAAKANDPGPAIALDLKVDSKNTKVSGSVTVTELTRVTEYDIQDGKITDKKFTFQSIQSGSGLQQQRTRPTPIPFSGELKDENTLTLVRLKADGSPEGDIFVFHRPAPK